MSDQTPWAELWAYLCARADEPPEPDRESIEAMKNHLGTDKLARQELEDKLAGSMLIVMHLKEMRKLDREKYQRYIKSLKSCLKQAGINVQDISF